MQASRNNNPEISVGEIAFFDNYLPSIEDGVYIIKSQTDISGKINTSNYFAEPITQTFEVRGPQFSLASTEIHSVYPPQNSNATYDQYLPNIVLNKRVLPWERYLKPDDKTIPWLCLLVFADGELTIDSKTNSALLSSTVADFLASDDEAIKPNIPRDTVAPDVLASLCSSIQVSQDVFQSLAPKLEELKYLSHVRQVSTGDQAILGFEDMGWFSVVTGNRLLKSDSTTGTRYFVHLVSLEGYYDILSGNRLWPKRQSDPNQSKDIALVSLYNWTFLSQAENLNFKELVENFALQAEGTATNLLLRKYLDTPPQPDVNVQTTLDRLTDGFVPLNYLTPSGENTFAWYRGPLTPTVAQPLPRPSPDFHYPSSSSMMIYDQTTGVFDQSYAAAWSLGRSLALADGTFTKALLKFRKSAYSLIGSLIDKLESVEVVNQSDLDRVVNSNVVRSTFQQIVNTDLDEGLNSLASQNSVDASNSPQSSNEPNPVLNSNDVDEKKSPVAVAKAFLSSLTIQDFLKTTIDNDLIPVAQWLATKQLLFDLPFEYLVPDQSFLPVESLRFFYVDQNWLDSFVDGAVSIGVQSSKDSFFNAVMRGVLNDAISKSISVRRDQQLGSATGDTEADSMQEALSGIIIRSEVVAAWPGLVVKAFKGDYATGTPLKLLRMSRLSTNVLLCIFLDIPDTVMLAEPQQGLRFGIEDDDIINLRQLNDPPGKTTGKTFPSVGGFTSFFRSNDGRVGNYVLKIYDGTNSIVPSLQQSQYLNATIGPAQFALEMVKAPEEISFIRPNL